MKVPIEEEEGTHHVGPDLIAECPRSPSRGERKHREEVGASLPPCLVPRLRLVREWEHKRKIFRYSPWSLSGGDARFISASFLFAATSVIQFR
jgi:hypothetical protein